MGLRLEFYTGDSKKIEAAFLEDEIEPYFHPMDSLQAPNVIQREADLSFHIIPKDLNLLSERFGKYSGQQPIPLRPYLSRILDEEDHGLLLVDDIWVKYVAAVQESDVAQVANAWCQAMEAEYPGEQIPLTPEITRAVGNLVNLCQYAQEKRIKVYHAWWE